MTDQATKAIFLQAIEDHLPDQWPGFLDRACGGDAELSCARTSKGCSRGTASWGLFMSETTV